MLDLFYFRHCVGEILKACATATPGDNDALVIRTAFDRL
jgi:hypothetical protein